MVIPFKSCSPLFLERAHGWLFRFSDLPHSDICERIGCRSLRLCVRTYCSFALALHPLTATDRNVDHCVRACRARLFGLEASPRTRLEQALAVCHRSSNWRTHRCKHSDMGKSRPRASWRWDFPNSLQCACAFSSCHETVHGWGSSC